MPLILAIEPDRRQAAKLVALAKGPLRAELVVAESPAKAFAALGDRVPDLILTSLLLSPKDENALGDRLRDLDAAGTQVQTLVIPVLGTAGRRARQAQGGLLKRLRGSKSKDHSPEGCDPAVFASQIAEYLERAAAERRAAAVALEDKLALQQDPVYATRQEAQTAGAATVIPRDGLPASEPQSVTRAYDDVWDPVYIAAPTPAVGAEPDPVLEAFRAAETEVPETSPGPSRREEDGWGEPGLDNQAAMLVAETASEPDVALASEPIDLAAFVEELQAAKRASAAPAKPTAAKAGVAARQAAARHAVAREAAAREAAAREAAAREAAAREAAAREAAAREAAAREAAAREKAAREAAAREKAAREAAAREEAAREAAARDVAAREKAAREGAARERAVREAAARERAAREAAAREAAARDAATLEHPLDADLAEFVAGLDTAAAAEKASRFAPGERTPPQPAVPAAVAPPAQPEWMQLLTAIKRDIEQLRTDQPETDADPSASEESSDNPPTKRRSGATGAERTRSSQTKKGKKAPVPVQDEWGFFDPDQCGFAALLMKLEEIADEEETPVKKPVGPRR